MPEMITIKIRKVAMTAWRLLLDEYRRVPHVCAARLNCIELFLQPTSNRRVVGYKRRIRRLRKKSEIADLKAKDLAMAMRELLSHV